MPQTSFHSTVLGGYPRTYEQAWSGLWAPGPRNIWIYGFGLSTSRHPWTSASDHHSGWSDLQKKIGRGTLDLKLTLDSYSGAPNEGPRASPERLLSLQSKVTNFMEQGSTVQALCGCGRRWPPGGGGGGSCLSRGATGTLTVYCSQTRCPLPGYR